MYHASHSITGINTEWCAAFAEWHVVQYTTQTHSRTGLNTEYCAVFVVGSVSKWEDPFDSAVYCLQTDGQSAMLTGTARHGLVRLWDKRQQEHVQVSFCSTGVG